MVLWSIFGCAQGFQRSQSLEHLSRGSNFVCGRPDAARGAGIVFGRVKLSTTSRDGKVLILKMAVPGETLGFSAVISGTPYEVTAETAGPCR